MTSQTALIESRVKLHAWKVGIEKRLLERKLQHEQVQLKKEDANPWLRILFFFVLFNLRIVLIRCQ